MSVNYTDLLKEMHDLTRDHGIEVRGGKRYSQVSTRVELFRRTYGDGASITTDILHLGLVKGEPVVIRASIAKDGVTIATGTASEVIGQGNVNSSSALENAETSAVGRALAVLGLHGGEMASLNEMERVDTKPHNPSAEGLMQAWEDAVMDALPDDPSAETLADAYADAITADVARYKSAKGLDGYLRKHGGHINMIREHAPERHDEIREAVTKLRQNFTTKEAA